MGEFSLLCVKCENEFIAEWSNWKTISVHVWHFFRALALTDAAAAQGKNTQREDVDEKSKVDTNEEKNLFTALRSLELYFSLKLTDIGSSIVHAVRSSRSAYLHTQRK